jgi:hypothetical protein
MLGESYVNDQRLLHEAFDELLSLSLRTNVALSSAELIGPLFAIATKPFLFSVLGEVNVGKSALINALQGSYLCRVSDLPETKMPMRHHCGDVKSEQVIDHRWVECTWPQTEWSHIEWFDFPGLSHQDKATRTEWMSWLQSSDVILMVVHHRNPWSALTWDFLARLDPAELSRVVIVVQACDEMSGTDFPVLSEHVRELAQKRLARELPVFLVSSRMAFQAGEAVRDTSVWQTSGMEALSNWLNGLMNHEAKRAAAIQSLLHLLTEHARQVEEHLTTEKNTLNTRVAGLERMEREMDQLFRVACEQQDYARPKLKKIFMEQSKRIAREFQSLLGVRSSLMALLAGRRISRELDQVSYEVMTTAVKEAVTGDVKWLQQQCELHWHTETMKRHEEIFFTEQSWSHVEALLKPAQQKLIDGMGQAAAQSLGQLRIRASLVGALHERSLGMTWWLSIFLLAVTIAGFTGFMGVFVIPITFLIIAMILWVVLVVYAQKTRQEISSFYLERMMLSDEDFISALKEPYENGVADFIQQYVAAWLPLRLQIASDDAKQQEKWQDLQAIQKNLSKIGLR